MPAETKTYMVVASQPIVIESEDRATSYNPGDIFQELDNNPSVVRHLSRGRIVETSSSPTSGPVYVAEGPPGPTGPQGDPGVSGEANTSSSAGGTASLVLPKVGIDLPFKGLTAGAGVTLVESPVDVTVIAGGEANTNSNAGGDEGLSLPKSGADLPLKGLTAGANVTLTPGANDITIAATVPTVPAPEDENNVLANQVFS